MDSLLIPSAIQRIRSFLIEMCGMKIKPWATTEETLTALQATLLARRQCSIFWASLRTLLERLAADLKTRQAAEPGTLLDNELLDGARYQALVDEIRATVNGHEPDGFTFRRLAGALSAPALGLLLLLGGAATVGCERSGLHSAGHDAAVSQPGSGGSAGATTSQPGSGGSAGFTPDALVLHIPDVALPKDLAVVPDAAPTSDSDIQITLPEVGKPDAAKPKDTSNGLDGAGVTIQDIMQACDLPASEQDGVLHCLATLRASWLTGLPKALAGLPCLSVENDLSCFQQTGCSPSRGEFDPATAFECPVFPVYIGVRFV
jgi:hypothetical protein